MGNKSLYLVRICSILVLAFVLWHCETPQSFPIQSKFCTSSNECAQGFTCQSRICTSTTATKEQITTEPTTAEVQPEGSPEADASTPAEAKRETLPETTPPETTPDVECKNNADCGNGELCINGKCGRCSKDADCPQGAKCLSSTCTAIECNDSSECKDGKVCIDYFCKDCTDDKQCAFKAEHICLNKRCAPYECKDNKDCNNGAACLQYRCAPCTDDFQCTGNGEVCDNGACIVKIKLKQDIDGAYQWDDTKNPYARHCNEYFTKHTSDPTYVQATQNGVYWIQPSNTPFKTYCLMNDPQHGGGWTLTLKVNGAKDTFRYDKALWTNTATHQPDELGMQDEKEAKLLSYATVGFDEVLLLFRSPKSTSGTTRKIVVQKKGATSLHGMISDGNHKNFDKNRGKGPWKQVVGGGSIQTKCNREGFNARGKHTPNVHNAVRIGIVGDEVRNCDYTDSHIGVGGIGHSCGGKKDLTAGNSAGYCSPDNGKKEIYSFVTVFVR